MKKVVLIMLSILLLSGCGVKSSDALKSFKDYNGKKETYELKGTMSIISNEDEFTYDISVGVKDSEYYKVTLVNKINDHEQVILKNDEGVYVVTPNLNKSFKFMSEWPKNSSQAYLIGALVDDVTKDSDAKIKEMNGGYTIDSKVNYPNNQKLDNETITVDKKFNIKKVEVKDSEGNILLTVEVTDINYNPKFNNTYFNLDELVTEDKTEDTKTNENQTTENNESTTTTTEEDCMKSCTDTEENCNETCKIETTSNLLEDIIYPLYVPTDTYLSSKDTVSTDNGNRVILTFSGVDPFILVEEVAITNDEMNIIPVNGEPLLMGSTIGALSDNSIYWTSNGVDYYLTSNTLDNHEMMTIAESVTNSSNLVAATK